MDGCYSKGFQNYAKSFAVGEVWKEVVRLYSGWIDIYHFSNSERRVVCTVIDQVSGQSDGWGEWGSVAGGLQMKDYSYRPCYSPLTLLLRGIPAQGFAHMKEGASSL